MVTVRFPPELEDQVHRAAARRGESDSEFIRAATAERTARVLNDDPRERLSGMIGAVASAAGSSADDTGEAFGDLLVEKHRR